MSETATTTEDEKSSRLSVTDQAGALLTILSASIAIQVGVPLLNYVAYATPTSVSDLLIFEFGAWLLVYAVREYFKRK